MKEKCGCIAYLPMSIMDGGEYPAMHAEYCLFPEAVALIRQMKICLESEGYVDTPQEAGEFLAKVEGEK